MSVKLMGMVFEAPFESPTEKLVMLALADFASDDGSNIYPSIATLARRTSLSDRAVQKTLKALIAAGFLANDGAWKSSTGPINRYRILGDQLTRGERGSPVNVIREGVNVVHQRGERHSRRGEPRSPNPLENHQGTVKNREREPAGAGAPSPDISPKTDSAFSEHPAVKLWVQTLRPKMQMATAQFQSIADHIGDTPEGLRRWTDVLSIWSEEGYNPNNVEGLLSRYDRVTRKAEQAGQEKAGQGRPASKRHTFRREQTPRRNGLQSEIDACRRNAKNARDRGDVQQAERMEAEAVRLEAQLQAAVSG
jgi:hypothetical protein